MPLNSKVVDHHAQQQSVLTMVAWAQECVWGNTRFDRSTMSRRGLALFHPKLFRDSRAVLKFEDTTIAYVWAARDRPKSAYEGLRHAKLPAL